MLFQIVRGGNYNIERHPNSTDLTVQVLRSTSPVSTFRYYDKKIDIAVLHHFLSGSRTKDYDAQWMYFINNAFHQIANSF